MSPNSNKRRQIILKEMGGTKRIHGLQRPDRALALASLMQEAPAKLKSEKAAAFSAFMSAVEKADPVRAKKIAEKHSLDEGKCRELVSAKVKALRSEEGNPQSCTASNFEILFGLDEGAKERFVAAMAQQLEHAYAKLDSDYAFAHVLFAGIINSEAELRVDVHTKDAAAGMAISFMQRRRFEDAFEVMQKHLLEGGRIEGEQGRLLKEAVKKMLLACSRNYAPEMASISRKHGGLPFMQEAILEMAPSAFKEPEKGESIFSFMSAFGLEKQARELGAHLANFYLGKADAQPGKFFEDYLKAAQYAMLAGLMDEMDEAMDKYLSMCEHLGEGGRPGLLEEGMRTAQAFSRGDITRELGKKAALHYLSKGEYGKAGEVARESGQHVLAYNIAEIRARVSL